MLDLHAGAISAELHSSPRISPCNKHSGRFFFPYDPLLPPTLRSCPAFLTIAFRPLAFFFPPPRYRGWSRWKCALLQTSYSQLMDRHFRETSAIVQASVPGVLKLPGNSTDNFGLDFPCNSADIRHYCILASFLSVSKIQFGIRIESKFRTLPLLERDVRFSRAVYQNRDVAACAADG